MKENIEALEELKDKLCNWKCYDETELQILINEFEKFPRKEFSLNYAPIFTNNILIENIVEIGKVFHSNQKISINVISSLGYIVCRYMPNPSSEIFNLFVEATKDKKVNYYVSLNISSFPQFSTWEDKWKYLLSMPLISPKKKSIVNFHREVKKLLSSNEHIPSDILKKIIETLKSQISSNELSEYSKVDYLKTISLLEQKEV